MLQQTQAATVIPYYNRVAAPVSHHPLACSLRLNRRFCTPGKASVIMREREIFTVAPKSSSKNWAGNFRVVPMRCGRYPESAATRRTQSQFSRSTIPAHRRSQHRPRSHPPFQYSRANRFHPWPAKIVETFGKARSPKQSARFPKRDDGSRRPHLHRAQSALPNLSGEKVLSRPRSSVASAKTKTRLNCSAH